jgi:hypothetical protein
MKATDLIIANNPTNYVFTWRTTSKSKLDKSTSR